MATDPRKTPNDFADAPRLLAGYFNAALDAAELAELERWVQADPANADTFARYAIEQRALENVLKHDRVGDLADLQVSEFEPDTVDPAELELVTEDTSDGSSAMDFVIDQALAERRKHDLEDEANHRLAVQQQEDALNRRFEMRRNAAPEPVKRVVVIPKAIVWLGLAAMISLVASVVYINFPPSQSAAPSPEARTRNPVNPEAGPVRVATVIATLDAFSANGKTVSVGTPVFDRPLDLSAGIIQIELTSGVLLTVEGPARLVLSSDMMVSLESGRLVGLVPEQAHGFVIRTSTMDIIDLGTEFAVEAAPAGKGSLVQVLDGSVRLEPGRYSQSFEPVVAEIGDALIVQDAGTPEAIEIDPNEYFRHVPSAYERLIHDARPLVYWRFDGLDERDLLAGRGSAGTFLDGLTPSDLAADVFPAGERDDRSLWLGGGTPADHLRCACGPGRTGGLHGRGLGVGAGGLRPPDAGRLEQHTGAERRPYRRYWLGRLRFRRRPPP